MKLQPKQYFIKTQHLWKIVFGIFFNFHHRQNGFYPKVDLAIWLRSCIKEVSVPLEGKVQGLIPHWITGDLLQNGPGKFYFGEDVFKHLFDGSALLQKYSIHKGKVHYQCRWILFQCLQNSMIHNYYSEILSHKFFIPIIHSESCFVS